MTSNTTPTDRTELLIAHIEAVRREIAAYEARGLLTLNTADRRLVRDRSRYLEGLEHAAVLVLDGDDLNHLGLIESTAP